MKAMTLEEFKPLWENEKTTGCRLVTMEQMDRIAEALAQREQLLAALRKVYLFDEWSEVKPALARCE